GKRQGVFAYCDEIDAWLQGSYGLEFPGRQSSVPRPALVVFPQLEKESPAKVIPEGWRSASRRRQVAAAGILVIVLGLISAWLLYPLPEPKVLGYAQITQDADFMPGPLLSDGTRLYFNRYTGTGCAVAQVPVTGGRPTVIRAGYCLIDISPDGSELLVG